MCGFCGFVRRAPGPTDPAEALVTRMRDTLVHRGPDDAGTFVDPHCALGHRRLSIVDVARGRQPMASEDGRMHLAYNGEIYNHLELRPALESERPFRTHCDTETLLRVLEDYGPAGVARLRGMFAFAFWDAGRRHLLLARDRFGIKPLYYAHLPDGSLHFGSEIKAILAGRALRPALNEAALPDYLANHAPHGEATLFEGVRRLPAGHLLHWEDGRIRIEAYWDPIAAALTDDGRTDARDEDALVTGFARHLEDAVRSHLMADVPLGVFLSGGIDSAAITALVASHADGPVKTFSVAFAEREANEHRWARLVAERYRTDHHETVVSPDQFFAALPAMVWHEDEPVAHQASVPLYFVAALAAQHVKVVLTGEGSDELLGGYARYWKGIAGLRAGTLYERTAPRFLRRAVRAGVLRMPANWKWSGRLERTFLARPATLEALYLDAFAVFPREMQARMLAPALRDRIGVLDPYAEHRRLAAEAESRGTLATLLHVDQATYLHELLMKQDQMSMAASIESRVPFLDHPLAEYAFRLPERMLLRGRTGKYVLREATRSLLPEEILTRPKMGFPVPFGAWVRGPYRGVVDEYVVGDRPLERGLFDPDAVRRLVGEHAAGHRDHAQRIWSLLNLELWLRLFVDDEPALARPAMSPADGAVGVAAGG